MPLLYNFLPKRSRYHMIWTWLLFCGKTFILYFKQHLAKQVLSLTQPQLVNFLIRFVNNSLINFLIEFLINSLINFLIKFLTDFLIKFLPHKQVLKQKCFRTISQLDLGKDEVCFSALPALLFDNKSLLWKNQKKKTIPCGDRWS